MKSLKNTQGFSLVELMVVVAIIGILAALSVGQVSKQIAKSRQAEAKTDLAALFTSEKSLFAEFSSYATNFQQMGLGYNGGLRYDVGFAADSVVLTAAQGYTGPVPAAGAKASSFCGALGAYANGCAMISSNGAVPAAPAGTLATNLNFTAKASAFIYANAGNKQDEWTIDDSKKVTNNVVGIY